MKISKVKQLVRHLNDGLSAFTAQARRERFDTAGSAADWNRDVNAKARALLTALGVRPLYVPKSFEARPPVEDEMASDIIFALASETGGAEWRDLLDLPTTFNEAVRHCIGAVWYLARIANEAAPLYEASKVHDHRSRRVRSDELSSRQCFVLYLAKAYELLTGEKLSRNPHVASRPHPFIRFCLRAFGIASTRIDGVAATMKFAAYPLGAEDILSIKSLVDTNHASIPDDVAKNVYDRLNRRRSQ